MLWIGGCGEFFAHKPTEIQAESILRELEGVPPVPDANIPIPSIYKEPPRILETKDGVKLFYFTQYLTVEKLSVLIKEQLGYKVSQNPATNQLIITCPTREETEIVLEFLKQVDVPPIQVKIDCLVSELYADLTMDRETTILIENLLGEEIRLGGKIDPDTGELLPAFPGASLRDVARSKIGLQIGYWRGVPGHQVRAMVDILESRGYLKILMNTTAEVVNGQPAKFEARDYVPLPKEVYKPGELMPYMTTVYEWVVDSLEVTPHVFADGYIGLETTAQIGSKSTPEGVKQIPIVTERTVQNKENRIRQGNSLIIGGIRKTEERDVIRGVPFLKDLPGIGLLFSSRDFEERAKEVIFILTPTISTGGMPSEEMFEEIERKQEPPIVPEKLEKRIFDPFGFEARKRVHEEELKQLEEERLEAEAEKEEARGALREAVEQIEKAKEETEKAKAEAEKAKANAKKARTEAQKAKKEAEEAKAEVEKTKQEAEKSKTEDADEAPG
jgi:hypothetical protein